MAKVSFEEFFQKEAGLFLATSIKVALSEDGPDLTSQALFNDTDMLRATITAKQDLVASGMDIIPAVFRLMDMDSGVEVHLNVDDGDKVSAGTMMALMQGPAAVLLKAERVILNFICHLSGIATLTRTYVDAVADTETTILDTRKTLPGLRYPEKYAVLCGGAKNHRLNLAQMLMLKDNHIDRAGGIAPAVRILRESYDPCPPIEVECRDMDEVSQAVTARADRIMLDNMGPDDIKAALAAIPREIETEISGGVSLDSVAELAALGPDYISIGRLTHSAPYADMGMDVEAG